MKTVKVCDAIMGSGKTESSITYMNEHKDERFIFITPYLAEASRIFESCPDLNFVEPQNSLARCNYSKIAHTAELIKMGANIATTHQAFKSYTPDMLDDIRNKHYTLFIDENVDTLEQTMINPVDMNILINSGYLNEDNGVITARNNDYNGVAFKEIFTALKSRDLMSTVSGDQSRLYYWTLPPDLITSFDEVFVLTYLFESQSMHSMFLMHNIPYEYIGVSRAGGEFRFAKNGDIPEYVTSVKDLVDIVEGRINNVGEERTALSMNWFSNADHVAELKACASNWFNNKDRGGDPNKRLWGTYSGVEEKIKGKGYAKAYLVFNAKATNDYRNRDCVMFAANPYMNVNNKAFFQSRGINPNEDAYALSIVVQWLWRSSIRDGKPIRAYIPSSRIRELTYEWIDKLSKGGDGR